METASLSVPDLFPFLFPFLVKLLKNTPCLARRLTSNKKLEESRHEKPSETEPDQLAEDVKPAPSPDGEVGTGGQTNGKKTLIDAWKAYGVGNASEVVALSVYCRSNPKVKQERKWC
ncbi:hypothetical protein LOK49_LG12G00978 [Camellia lanceoleosa]|uniref:Uncharacterized protein n=1 Tax=Camellia lanceoleosa TaxID=1840588 RepID=A0ACC0FVA9_9ERIC|nr:hypothetical protein LOK49_LG12G00978 [Camellia lanceoleosa]